MGLVRGRPGPETFITFRGRTIEDARPEHDLERANEDARRIWLNKMMARNRNSRYKLVISVKIRQLIPNISFNIPIIFHT